MNYYVSVCTSPGIHAKTAVKVPLQDVLRSFSQMASKEKHDNWLLYGGYVDVPNEYMRNEANSVMKINVLFIDCDNGEDNKPQTWDKDIIEKFNNDMKEYTFLTWETYSSTPERPKFRALIPLDKTIQYTKDVKKSVTYIFTEYSDKKASWYFAPDSLHLSTLHFNKGTLFPSSEIIKRAEKFKTDREMTEAMFERIAHVRAMNQTHKSNPEGWRNLPSVKKCLEGLHVGERDNALCAACFAMDKNGYRSSIPQFLDECCVDNAFKNKFRNKYR